ncbi:hypothetical protein JD844_024396, partial [Phrynosoma platyrhinos]
PYCGNMPVPEEIILDSNEATIHFESRSNHMFGQSKPLWGNGIQTSLLCKSAIHAGVIADELGGQISVVLMKGTRRYQGILANDILSQDGSLSNKRFIFSSNGGASQMDKQSIIFFFLFFSFFLFLQGIRTTGSTMLSFNYYVKTFIVNYKNNNSKWRAYKGILSNEEKVFKANSNHGDIVRNNFIPPIVARYVRIIPQSWHKRIALKVELLGCHIVQINSSIIHPLWQRPSQSTGVSVRKEDRTITEPLPSGENKLGVKLTAILVPVSVMLFLFLISGICISAALRKKGKKGIMYGSCGTGKPGFWKQIKHPFVRHASTEFTISYNNEKEMPQKLDLVTRDMADYQQPLMIGTGTVTRKGSTFRPMDTEDEKKGSSETGNHYLCPQRTNHHDYALPLTNQEPEYATPIVERHIGRENAFSLESCYNIPTVSSAYKYSLSADNFTALCKTEAESGDYQTPQSQKEYDKPKNNILPMVDYSTGYQKPQIGSGIRENYSAPRHYLKPINQTAVTALL